MKPKQIIALLLVWFVLIVDCWLILLPVLDERYETGRFEVVGLCIVAITLFLWTPALVAFKSSGKWYSPKKLQPVLQRSNDSLSWNTTTRHFLVPFVLMLPPVIGLIVLGLSGGLDDTRIGPLVPIYIAIILITLAMILLRLIVQNTTVEIQSKSLTMRSNELPFLKSTKRVESVEYAAFGEVFNPLPAGCLLTLSGVVESEWLLCGKTLRRSTTRIARIPVPHFANATPDEFDELLNQYLGGIANAGTSAGADQSY